MFADIVMAFAIAALLEWFALISNVIKQVIIWIFCICVILIYFISGCQLDFITKMDFGVWLSFVILFNKIVILGINKLKGT